METHGNCFGEDSLNPLHFSTNFNHSGVSSSQNTHGENATDAQLEVAAFLLGLEQIKKVHDVGTNNNAWNSSWPMLY